VYFSPTGTTKLITETIAHEMQAERIEMVDCTKRSQRTGHALTFYNEVVILGVPVYYGRIPEEVAAYFATFTAKQTPVVLVVVYGNRAYDDALKELHDIAVTRGFLPLAGGAFIGEHSYSSTTFPIAHGRPDVSDLQHAREFGATIREQLHRLDGLEMMKPISVPGQVPYCEPQNLHMLKKMRKILSLTPKTNMRLCTQCRRCAEVCPTGAICRDEVGKTDKWHCLVCFACVKGCPSGARRMKNWFFTQAIKDLHKSCQERKEPEWYL
jgi:flavodoxin/ferredoxin